MEQSTLILSSSSSSSISDEGPSTSAEGPSSRFPGEERESGGGDLDEAPVITRQLTSTSYRVGYVPRATSAGPDELHTDDTLSCVIVVLTFWFFVSMTLIMGIFGSEDLQLGPYSSILLQPNPLFVDYLKMETSKDMKAAPVLYGFYKAPPLDVAKTWSESRIASVKPESHEEWVYYLNEGSQIKISYNVPSSSPLLLIIAKGIEGMAEWLEDPSYPDNAMSWNVIRGNGTVMQDISKSCDYYVAVGNFNSENVEVAVLSNCSNRIYFLLGVLHDLLVCLFGHQFLTFCTGYFSVISDTTDTVIQFQRSLKVAFPGGNAAVLTTGAPQEGAESERLYVKLSFEPRWMTYFLGIGGMTSIMLWAFNFLNRVRRNNEDVNEAGGLRSERAPLLSQKDDDLSSLGSSYDSGSQNDEDSQDCLEEGLIEGSSAGEGGRKYSSRQLCVICFDAPKDCFFIPCGHCASCYTCGTRIAEIAGTCPICRRKMKKVRRIYNV